MVTSHAQHNTPTGDQFVPPPPGWGNDELSKFIQQATDNTYVTVVQMPDWYRRLVDIDAAFMRIGSNLINAKDTLAALLLLRSHSAYRGACRMALSTQVNEVWPLIRTCIEYAGYARLIFSNEPLGKAWLNRHKDDASMKLVKQEFTLTKVRARIAQDDAKLAENFDIQYQATIDFGAHPNERSVTGSMSIIEGEDQILFRQAYLHGGGLSLDHAMKATAQAGLCSLMIFQFQFKERFMLLGLREDIQKLRQGL